MFFDQVQYPIAENGETEFVFAERGKFFASSKLFQQEMTGENALDVEARVFDVSDEVVAQHGGIVLHPCFLQVFGFLAQGVVEHGIG